MRAGADAVYFGLQGFNARARATNFDEASLGETMRFLHERGVRGYVTLNTLAFDEELPRVEAAVRACASAGVDAVIVQDLGVARLVRALAPTLPVHASTQMTCTDAASVELARGLGARRVVLARELSVADIEAIGRATDAELEVFVHGALCVAYSGQCLTSEAIGGRSANRGACAQACRLPYDLMVDGAPRDLGEAAYLLSPEDLEASALVPALAAAGVVSLKIEGRLKGPDYVAATTRLYRGAVAAATGSSPAPTEHDRALALQTYTRGSGPGFLRGVDHQRLVDGRTCDHRGLRLGSLRGVIQKQGRRLLDIDRVAPLRRGHGVLVEGRKAGLGELGGRVWALSLRGKDVESAEAGERVEVWLGPDRAVTEPSKGSRVWKTSDPGAAAEIGAATRIPSRRTGIRIHVEGVEGERPRFSAWLSGAPPSDAPLATILGDSPIGRADRGLSPGVLMDKLGKLTDTPFVLEELTTALPEAALVPVSSVNRARRALVQELLASSARSHETTGVTAESMLAEAAPPPLPAPGGLFVLARTLPQARAALEAGADGVYLDFLELTGTGAALRALRSEGHRFVGVAPPRIRKPGEDKIDRYLASLEPDAILVRGLGALHEGRALRGGALRIGDFSLNAANSLTASWILEQGLSAFTPSFDLDSAQLLRLLAGPLGAHAEVVVHHPMPLFHMEHCVFAALLSKGKDHLTCGRPCERHEIALRDRAGMAHPVVADVGCRNTVFHEKPQSAADLVPRLLGSGVRRFRVELVREAPDDVKRLITAYRALLSGVLSPPDLFRAMHTRAGYGVVRGSLRILNS